MLSAILQCPTVSLVMMGVVIMLSGKVLGVIIQKSRNVCVVMKCHYAKWHNAECRYNDCSSALTTIVR